MNRRKVLTIAENLFTTGTIIFWLIILYQILKRAFGGSWSTDNLATSLLFINLACTFTIAIFTAQQRAEVNHLTYDIRLVAEEIREVSRKTDKVEHKVDSLKKEAGNLKQEIRNYFSRK